MLFNKSVTITVKGTNGNVHLVTVEKRGENGSLNVADKLLVEGLVTPCSGKNLQTEHHGTYFYLITSNELIGRTVHMWNLSEILENSTSGMQYPCVFCSFTCFVFCRWWR